MSTTALWIFEKAMHLMDEASEATGAADTADTAGYKHRTLPILNVLRLECWPASDTFGAAEPGKRPVCPEITGFDSPIGLDDTLCQSVLPYGLAAHLLLDENPAAAAFFQQRYQELLGWARRTLPAVSEDIADVYGGVEYGRYSYW